MKNKFKYSWNFINILIKYNKDLFFNLFNNKSYLIFLKFENLNL